MCPCVSIAPIPSNRPDVGVRLTLNPCTWIIVAEYSDVPWYSVLMSLMFFAQRNSQPTSCMRVSSMWLSLLCPAVSRISGPARSGSVPQVLICVVFVR